MLHRFDSLAVRILIFVRGTLAHKLLAALWMLPLAESREIFSGNSTGNAELRR